MVCVFWLLSFFLLFTDLKEPSTMFIASFPEILITEIAPAPDGVANAIMVSLLVTNLNFKQK